MRFQTVEAADSGAIASATLATVSWVAQLNDILTLIATGVAIWAGVGAALYHFEAWRQKRRNR